MKRRSAFTLIELLIVVAIIAILAAIAVPNFLEAQTRSRVGRTMNDLRTIALAMETYRIDHNGYPMGISNDGGVTWVQSGCDIKLLTTPISYLNQYPVDVFKLIAGSGNATYRLYAVRYLPSTTQAVGYYRSYNDYPRTAWMTWSLGPDTLTNTDGYRPYGRVLLNEASANPGIGINKDRQYIGASGSYFGMRYDATNGTVSYGDVYRFEGEAQTHVN